jgi:hypothetical protein
LQRVTELLAQGKRAFVRGPNVCAAAGFQSYHRRMRFDVCLMHGWHCKCILDDLVGLPETFLDFAFFPFQVNEDIAWGVDLVQ